MAGGTNYDDNAFYFFATTLLFFFVLPSSLYIWHVISKFKKSVAVVPKVVTLPRSAEEHAVLERHHRRTALANTPELWTPGFRCFTITTAVAGVLMLLCIAIAMRTPSLATYDPFAILGIVAGANERDIRTAYRKLSLTNHPDKGGDAAIFQKIAKAYEALSNPEARANWEKFGNPDGPQAMEAAIGLPSFLVHPVGKYIFLFSYMLILLLVVPYVLYRFFKSRGSGQAQAEGLAAALAATAASPAAAAEREALALEMLELEHERRAKELKRARGISQESLGWLANHMDHMLASELNTLQIVGGIQEGTPRAPWQESDAAELRDACAELTGPAPGAARVGAGGSARMVPNLTFHAAMPPMTPSMIDANRILLYSHLWRRALATDALRWHKDAYVSALPDALLLTQGQAIVRMWQMQQLRNAKPEQLPPNAKVNRRWLGASGMAFLATLPRLSALVVQALPDRQVLEGSSMPLAFAQVFTLPQFTRMQRRCSAARTGLRSLGHLLRMGKAGRAELLFEAAGGEEEAAGGGEALARVTTEMARLERLLGDIPVLEGSVHAFVRATPPFGWVQGEGSLVREGASSSSSSSSSSAVGGAAAGEASASFPTLSALRAHAFEEQDKAGCTQVYQGDNVTLRVHVRHLNLLSHSEEVNSSSSSSSSSSTASSSSAASSRSSPHVKSKEDYAWLAGKEDACTPRGPALPLVHAPHFPRMLKEEWCVLMEDTVTKHLVMPVHWNPQQLHGQVFSPTHAEECFDVFLGDQLGLGRHTIAVHMDSPHYLGLQPEAPFTVTIQVNARVKEESTEDEEEEEEEEEEGEVPFSAESILASFMGGAAASDNTSDVTEEEIESYTEQLDEEFAEATAPKSKASVRQRPGKGEAAQPAAAAAGAAAGAGAGAGAAANPALKAEGAEAKGGVHSSGGGEGEGEGEDDLPQLLLRGKGKKK